MSVEQIEAGFLIQIRPEHHWAGCIAVVEEVRPWGVIAYVRVPLGGDAYIRIETGDFDVVGRVGTLSPPVGGEAEASNGGTTYSPIGRNADGIEVYKRDARPVDAGAAQAAPWPADTPEGREEVARIIYNSFPYDGPLGKQKPDWIPNGNSFMQDKARETADTLIWVLRPATYPLPSANREAGDATEECS